MQVASVQLCVACAIVLKLAGLEADENQRKKISRSIEDLSTEVDTFGSSSRKEDETKPKDFSG